jgi:hypothetical protein
MQYLTKCRNICSNNFLTEQENFSVLLLLMDNLDIILRKVPEDKGRFLYYPYDFM